MLDNLPNSIVKNILNEEEISKILSDIESYENPRLNGHVGQLTFDIRLDQSVIDKVTKIAEQIYGGPVILQEYNLSRYHNNKMIDREDDIIPILFPHTDFFPTGRVTLDYQFRSNTSWGIVVDNKDSVSEYILNDNELLSFSGTHQVHWRNKKVFNDNDFMEMIFFHFEPVGAENISINFKNNIKDWAKSRFLEWAQTPGKNSNLGTEEENIRRYDRVPE